MKGVRVMKKKRIIIGVVIVLAAVILLTPFKLHLRDGGSKVYKALTYKVYKYHRINSVEPYTTEEEARAEIDEYFEIIDEIEEARKNGRI